MAFKMDHLQPVKLILFKKIPPFLPAFHNKLFLITAERRGKEGAGAENWKREFFKSGRNQGLCVPGAFKLDHLQPVKLILLQKKVHLFTQPPIINHFLLVQREEGRKEQGLKIGKGNSSKVDETKGCVTLGHSNWTICSLLKWCY